MGNVMTISLAGLDQTMAEIKAYPQDVEKIINKEFAAFGRVVVNGARRRAPVDEGRLRESISAISEPLSITISVNVDYAAYLEFGTRSFAAEYVASLPAEWQEFALQYKGSAGGSFQEMVMRITEWVKRKGFAAQRTKSGAKSKSASSVAAQEQAAYLIARSIIRKGIKPANNGRGYLFPAFQEGKLDLIANLKAQLNAKQ